MDATAIREWIQNVTEVFTGDGKMQFSWVFGIFASV
jgi:hypothetical protein